VIGPTVAHRAAKSQPTGTNEANYRQRSVAYPLELRLRRRAFACAHVRPRHSRYGAAGVMVDSTLYVTGGRSVDDGGDRPSEILAGFGYVRARPARPFHTRAQSGAPQHLRWQPRRRSVRACALA
jgi:hypothetical protein